MSVWENLRCAVLWSTGHRYAFWKNIDNLPEVRDRTAQILAGHQPDRAPRRAGGAV